MPKIISISITEDEHRQLKTHAGRNCIGVSQFVRCLLARFAAKPKDLTNKEIETSTLHKS